MDFEHSDKVKALMKRVSDFMNENVYPNNELYVKQVHEGRYKRVPVLEELKAKARSQGLWNLFYAHGEHKLTVLEYAPLAEIMGRVLWASEVFNCSAPDTGNMETIAKYGNDAQKEQWLKPLLAGEIRSCFSMTEPDVASSDATNIQLNMRREGNQYVINGRKWFSSGAMSEACKIIILMGKTDPDNPSKHKQQSMILVPMDTPGVRRVRDITVMGFHEMPHGHPEVAFENVRVPVDNVLLGEGRGFEIAQGRLGGGRIHHAMRNIGQGEVALEKMCRRLMSRRTFGKFLGEHATWRQRVAESRSMIDQARLMVLYAASRIDRDGAKAAKREIAMGKIAAASMLTTVIDWAIQAHGAAGVTEDFQLSEQYARARVMHLVDGPDEVHWDQIGRTEMALYAQK